MSTRSQHDERAERREAEIALLQAMYPSDITWHEHRQEIAYKPEVGGVLVLRVPDEYPEESLPVVIEALDKNKNDIRDFVRKGIESLLPLTGDEMLDTVIQGFEEIIRERQEASNIPSTTSSHSKDTSDQAAYKTVIIWLHHLLNTNKRKLALNPSVNTNQVSGITKPGYPGVLVYSGVAQAVDAHVSELRNQRWQAFQIRLEEVGKGEWTFSHGFSIKEVESMSEVAQGIALDDNRRIFLEAVGIK